MQASSTEWKRHYQPLSEQETDVVVELVADLIVNFLKSKRVQKQSPSQGQAPDNDRNAVHPEI